MTQLETVTFFSPPGIYEISTAAGPVYEIEIPEDPTAIAYLIISQLKGQPEDRDGKSVLSVVDIMCELGEAGRLTYLTADGSTKEVTTKMVQEIEKVG